MISYESGNIIIELADGSELSVNKKDTSFVKLDDFDFNDFK